MRKIEFSSNQNGITLIEILVSITILAIILGSFTSIFLQMGTSNTKIETNSQAVHSAKQIVVEWQRNQEVNNFLSNPVQNERPTYLTSVDDFYYTESTRENVTEVIKIAKESDLASEPVKAHQIHVQLINEQNNVIGERFGYIIVEE